MRVFRFQPLISSLSDIFGRKELLFLSLLLFTIGTIICCIARNFVTLIAGRTIQGVGGGGVIVMQFVIFSDIIPLRKRPIFTAINQMAWALGTIFGPLIGALFVQHSTWRWIFYMQFPFCGITLVMTPLVVRIEQPKRTFNDMFFRVDWMGGFLFIGSMTSFLMAITWGGNEFPWGSFRTLLPMLVGIAGLVATIFWEKNRAKVPFVRLSLFTSSSAYAAFTCAVVQGILVSSSHITGQYQTLIVSALLRELLPRILLSCCKVTLSNPHRRLPPSHVSRSTPCLRDRWHPNVQIRALPLGHMVRPTPYHPRNWPALFLRNQYQHRGPHFDSICRGVGPWFGIEFFADCYSMYLHCREHSACLGLLRFHA